MQIFKSKYYIVLGLLLIVIGITFIQKPLYKGFMNHRGYCFKQGRFLSEKEKIDAVVRYLIAHYPPVLVRRETKIVDGIKKPVTVFEKPNNAIPYKDIEEFYRVNKQCCKFKQTGKKGYPRGFWARVSGATSGFVHVHYRVRYKAKDGSIESKEHTLTPAVSNCGDVWSGV